RPSLPAPAGSPPRGHRPSSPNPPGSPRAATRGSSSPTSRPPGDGSGRLTRGSFPRVGRVRVGQPPPRTSEGRSPSASERDTAPRRPTRKSVRGTGFSSVDERLEFLRVSPPLILDCLCPSSLPPLACGEHRCLHRAAACKTAMSRSSLDFAEVEDDQTLILQRARKRRAQEFRET